MRKRRRSEGRRIFVAVHEAGHAAVRWELGLSPPSLICIDKRGAQWGFMETVSDGPGVGTPNRGACSARALVALAGLAANLRLDPGSRTLAGMQAERDYEQARDAVACLHRDVGRRRAALQRLQRAADRAIVRNWARILALAAALLRRGRLTGRGAWGVLARH